MKIGIEIDATPAEMRSLVGLPDLERVQTAVLDAVQQRLLAEVDRFSPETVLRSWLSSGPATSVQDVLGGLLHQAAEVSRKAAKAGTSRSGSARNGTAGDPSAASDHEAQPGDAAPGPE